MTDSATDAGQLVHRQLGYWNARRQMIYYQALYQFVCVVGRNAGSLIDIGSASAQYVDWFQWIPARYILDFRIAKKPEGVTCIESDFLAYEPQQKFDVVLCLQVLEHVPNPAAFCAKLKSIARQLLVSVPYKWLGNTPGHIHDPVDEKKLEGWMGSSPTIPKSLPSLSVKAGSSPSTISKTGQAIDLIRPTFKTPFEKGRTTARPRARP
jgi:hypothetical protein